MKSVNIYILLSIQIISLNLLSAQKNDSKSALEVINNSIEATGGKENLKDIKTLYTDIFERKWKEDKLIGL